MPKCARCGSDFPPGAAACPDCDTAPIATTEDLTADRPDPDGQFVQVAEANTAFDAELLAGRLRSAGLEAQVIDQSFHQEPLTNVRDWSVVRVMVAAADEAKARELLARSVEIPEDAEETTDDGGSAPGGGGTAS